MAIQVGAYHLRVREKHTKDNEVLDRIGNSSDFLQFVMDTLETCKTAHHNDIASERIALTERFTRMDRVLEGRLEIGDYGQEGNVRDARKGKTVFRKSKNHADAKPIFFRLYVPEGRDEALLLIEKNRKTSAKTGFMSMLRFHFKQTYDAYALIENPVLPEGVFDEYFRTGRVQKISFVKMGIPTDLVDLMDGGHEELKGQTEFTVRAPKNRFLPLKRSILRGTNPLKQIQDLYELQDLDYENIKVEVVIGKNRRTVDLGSKHAVPLYDISDKVTLAADGNPDYDGMSKALADLANDIESGSYASS